MNKKHVVGYTVTALVALGIGAAGASGDSDPGAAPAAPTQTVTATKTAAAKTSTVTAKASTVTATKTVKVAGPTKTVTAEPAAAVAAMPGDGTYEVGVDVQPGTYVSTTPGSGNCYWARLTGKDGIGGITENGNSAGQVVVTIKAGDKFFESRGCSDWTKR